jgi:hypothetical protein
MVKIIRNAVTPLNMLVTLDSVYEMLYYHICNITNNYIDIILDLRFLIN